VLLPKSLKPLRDSARANDLRIFSAHFWAHRASKVHDNRRVMCCALIDTRVTLHSGGHIGKADSTGRRNSLMESLRRCFVLQCLPRPFVETPSDRVELRLRIGLEFNPLWASIVAIVHSHSHSSHSATGYGDRRNRLWCRWSMADSTGRPEAVPWSTRASRRAPQADTRVADHSFASTLTRTFVRTFTLPKYGLIPCQTT
jgi:hypothetical protein